MPCVILSLCRKKQKEPINGISVNQLFGLYYQYCKYMVYFLNNQIKY
nr:MAG TPA: hypothetical protein [Bacteriophage sp.]